MAATDALAFPKRVSAYRLYGRIVSSTTGNPITGGLTSASCQISKDGGNFAASANAPVEILGSDGSTKSGYFYVDLTSSETTCTSAFVRVSASNTGSVEFSALLLTSAPTQIPTDVWNYDVANLNPIGRGRAATMGGRLIQVFMRFFNKAVVDGSTVKVYLDDSSTVMLQASMSQTSGTTEVDESV